MCTLSSSLSLNINHKEEQKKDFIPQNQTNISGTDNMLTSAGSFRIEDINSFVRIPLGVDGHYSDREEVIMPLFRHIYLCDLYRNLSVNHR